ncbi:MAG: Crp/Fnr family transcriptional regulator [Flectobacillus sp.]|nr:Crp/Fnr family transcriptional regulator [Flectobacillus sp.]
MNSLLQEVILSHVPFLSQRDLKVAEKSFSLQKLKKGDIFLKDGDVATKVAFVNKGILVNIFPSTEKGNIVTGITSEGKFTTVGKSFLTQTPSDEMIMAIEDCEILVITNEQVQEIYLKNKNLERAARFIFEAHKIFQNLKVRWFVERDALKRYEAFAEYSPSIVERVPQYMIASYLGITPESLSRLIANRKTKAK